MGPRSSNNSSQLLCIFPSPARTDLLLFVSHNQLVLNTEQCLLKSWKLTTALTGSDATRASCSRNFEFSMDDKFHGPWLNPGNQSGFRYLEDQIRIDVLKSKSHIMQHVQLRSSFNYIKHDNDKAKQLGQPYFSDPQRAQFCSNLLNLVYICLRTFLFEKVNTFFCMFNFAAVH